jgi:hypothetical protein
MLSQDGNLVDESIADSPISSCSASCELINILIDVIRNGAVEIVNGNSHGNCTSILKKYLSS